MPSSSEKPLTTSDRLALFLAGAMQQAESIALRHPSDSKIVTRDRLMTSRIPGMVEELEALLESGLRESRAVSPDSEKRDADYANRNIRTMELANAVAVHLGLNPADEIPFEELTRRLHDLPPVDGFGSHKADLAELRVLQKKVQEGKSLSPSPAATSAIVSTYHGPVGGNDERGVVVRLCVDDVIEVRPEKGPVARLSAFSAQALAYSLLDFAIQPYAGDIARRAIDAKFGASPADTDTQDAERLDWLDAEARRLMDRDPLGYRTRVILTAEEVNNAGRDIRKAIDNRRSSSTTPPTTQE